VDDPGSHLAEYRLFRAAVDGFLADATGQASRSFLAAVGPEAAPAGITLAISQERLVGALRGVLARLPEAAPSAVPATPVLVTTVVSVEERCAALRSLFAERGAVPFEDLFAAVATREEAVAVFLALLELIKRGVVLVEEGEAASGVILLRMVAGVDGSPDPGSLDPVGSAEARTARLAPRATPPIGPHEGLQSPTTRGEDVAHDQSSR
jgi:chromatin segregation and condensation protein Rec8/ScpA/Scc1 (kleisin family)